MHAAICTQIHDAHYVDHCKIHIFILKIKDSTCRYSSVAAAHWCCMEMATSLSVLVLLCMAAAASAQLSPTFYSTSCPNALATIRTAVRAAVAREPRMGASLLRLHFHDCFVQASPSSQAQSSYFYSALTRSNSSISQCRVLVNRS
jgi:hypothetical protein